MKPINEMTDQELAEAVAVEVLGWVVKNDVPEFAFDKDDRRFTVLKVLSPEGREAIENELERRGWWWQLGKQNDDYMGEIYDCPLVERPPISFSVNKNKYRAIAEAALMAVRGEGSHGKD